MGRGVVAVAGVRRGSMISGGGCAGSWRVREGSLELDPEPPSRFLRVGARLTVSGIGGGCGELLGLDAEKPLGLRGNSGGTSQLGGGEGATSERGPPLFFNPAGGPLGRRSSKDERSRSKDRRSNS